MATVAPPVENDSVAIILAWLPGALKTQHRAERSREVLDEFIASLHGSPHPRSATPIPLSPSNL